MGRCIVLVDMRENNGKILAMKENDFDIKIFDTEGDAARLMEDHTLGVFPFAVLNIDEIDWTRFEDESL